MNAISNPRFKRRVLMAAAACCVLATSSVSVMAQDDDEPTFEQQMFRKLLGRDKPPIDYRERSPLVIPPSAELPSPESGGATAQGSASAAWPQDADLAARQKSGRSRIRGAEESDRAASALMSPDDIRRGKIARSERKRAVTMSDNESARVLRPDEIGGKQYSLFQLFGKSMTTEKPQPFTTEPVRETLTQPPPGYRTPSPEQPYQPPKDEPIFKIPSLWDRGTGDPN